MGMPGKPAPEPTSITRLLVVGRCWSAGGWLSAIVAGNRRCAANKDSPKWRVTVSLRWGTAGRVVGGFPREKKYMDIDIFFYFLEKRDLDCPPPCRPPPPFRALFAAP